ncbi:DUF1800 family protein [Limibacter armeniacum]|uniref:DUF1800 domain-containing protein n=1 Tax=Limibacter armeniacum TaxID=466084 RepID=UPI002FE659E1
MSSLNPTSGTLGTKSAKHLLNRLTFGVTKQAIDEFAPLSISQALDLLMQVPTETLPPIDPDTNSTWVSDPTAGETEGLRKGYIKSWWLGLMHNNGHSLAEKMAYFYHTHFTTIESRVPYSKMIYWQISLFRYYALGNFKELAKKICLDNAMMFHLDAHLNEDNRPNENFAREFLELYTIGKGEQVGDGDYTNYTEQDVRAAAQVLSGFYFDETGASIDIDSNIEQGKINSSDGQVAIRHFAKEDKKFSAAFGNTIIAPPEVTNGKTTVEGVLDELDQLIEMIFAQEATAKHICRKLYRFFVYYQISEEVENTIISGLANTMIANNYEMEPVLRQLFSSQHFFDTDNSLAEDNSRGAIIKSPLEIALGGMKYFGITLPDPQTDAASFYEIMENVLGMVGDQGMNFYEPFEVAGYTSYHQAPAYNRNWITPNYLAYRYLFGEYLVFDKGTKLGLEWDTVAFIVNNVSEPGDATLLVKTLTDTLLPEIITDERFNYFLYSKMLDNFSLMDWENEWRAYQITGNDETVRPLLETLLIGLLQSPEYQLC